MIFFCLLWVPLLYFVRRPVSSGESGKGIWILLMGFGAVVIHYFIGDLIRPGGFGFSRWMSGFIDLVALPVLFPFVVCLLLLKFKKFPANIDIIGFILLIFTDAEFAVIGIICMAIGCPICLIMIIYSIVSSRRKP